MATTDEVVFLPEATAFLSLDLAGPFYWPMGLCVRNVGPVQRTFRELVGSKLFTSATPRLLELEWDELDRYSEAVYLELTDRYGVEFRKSFQYWLNEIYSPISKRHDWFWYQTSVIGWATALRKRGHDLVGFGPITDRLTIEFQRSRDLSDVIDLVTTAKQTGRSEWDAKVYATMPFTNDERLATEMNEDLDADIVRYPFDRVIDAVEKNRFQNFWEFLLRNVPPESLESLRRLAERQTRLSLCPPESLRRTMHWTC